MNEEDISLINSLLSYIVEWQNGVRTSLFNQLSQLEGKDQRLDLGVTSPTLSLEMVANVPYTAYS